MRSFPTSTMHTSTEPTLPFQPPAPAEAAVQERPVLGNLPQTRGRMARWLVAIDLGTAVVALAVIGALNGLSVFPAMVIAPLVVVIATAVLGAYRPRRPGNGLGARTGISPRVVHLVVAAVYVWAVSLLMPLEPGAQLALWALFAGIGGVAKGIGAPYLIEPVERWVLVGDSETSERLQAYAPLSAWAKVVCTVPHRSGELGNGHRSSALEIVERYAANRVVIASSNADDRSLLQLIRDFRSTGAPVSLLPSPLDLLEAPAATPSEVGGVSLINVEMLASRAVVPYIGPDRRNGRRPKVSVVVPAINEERNIGAVLSRLPDDLHEVILVDGRSQDSTIEVARQACPGIRVFTQSGRGKGDAFRTGFAAVTGNLVVMLDADGSADPAEIPRFVAALEAGADFAKGSRFLEGGGSEDITRTRQLGNSLLSGTANVLHGTRFTDLCYGYNAFWTRCLPFISLDMPGFEVETLINLRIATAGLKITEVPSYEARRVFGQSNLKTFRDGSRVLGTIFREALRTRSIATGHHAEPLGVPQNDVAARVTQPAG